MSDTAKLVIGLLAAFLVAALDLRLPADVGLHVPGVAVVLVALWWRSPRCTVFLGLSALGACLATSTVDGAEVMAAATETVLVVLATAAIAWRQHVEIRAGAFARASSDARLRGLLDHVPGFFSLKDTEGRFLELNRHVEEWLGVSAAQARGRTLAELSAPPLADSYHLADKAALESGEVTVFDAEIIGPDGSRGSALVTKFPVTDAAGNLIGIGTLGVDITERRRTETALRESEARLRALIENIPALVHLKDAQGRYVLVNHQFEKWFGVSAADATGRTHDEIPFHGLVDSVRMLEANVLATQRTGEIEAEVVGADGRTEVHRIIKFPVVSAENTVRGVGTLGFDISRRHAAEQKAARHRELLVDAIEALASGFAYFDRNDILVLKNAWYPSRYLRDVAVIGASFKDIVRAGCDRGLFGPVEQADALYEERMHHYREGNGIHEFRTPDDAWMQARYTRTRGGGTVLLLNDVTERRRAEEALRQSEANYRSLIDDSAVGVLIHEDFKPLFANRALARMFGYDGPGEVMALSSALLLAASHERARVRRHVEATKHVLPGAENLEHEGVRKDGRPIWVDSSAHPVTWRGRRCRAVLFVDKTERRHAESLLREAIEGISEAFGVFDGADRLILCNESFHRRFPVPGATAIGMHYETMVRSLVDGGAVARTLPDGSDWLQTRLAWHANPVGSFEYQLTNGHWVQVGEQRTGNGNTVYFVKNVTESKNREAELRHAQKMEAIGHLTGGIAHDFNNLLSVIVGNLELASDDLPQGSSAYRYAGNALGAAERGASLTQRLLAFSRKQPLQPRGVDARDLVAGMIQLLHRTLGETIEIVVEDNAGLWTCRADPGQLENAILNLAINARDAMPDGGTLSIGIDNARRDEADAPDIADVIAGQYVLIAVKDTGEGMTREVRERAFEPFFTTKGVGQGSGLGLSMVYGFIKQSGGQIDIDSEPGNGTVVRMYLPRQRVRVEAAPLVEHAAVPQGRGETILLVEDDADVRALVLNMLADLGYMVWAAETGAAALDLLTGSRRFDMLLTDVVLPGGMNGRALADVVRRQQADIHVLFMSGYTEDAVIHQGRLDEGVSLLQKPFRRRDLAIKIREVLDSDDEPKMSVAE